MEKVLGVGGIFFRSCDAAALIKWYTDPLGIDNIQDTVWMQEAGPRFLCPLSMTPIISAAPNSNG